LLAGTNDGVVHVLDIDSIEELKQFKFHDGGTATLGLSADRKLVITGCDDGIVKVWQIASGKQIHSVQADETAVSAVALAPDGKVLATGDPGGHIRLWDLNKGTERLLPGARLPVDLLEVSADGKTVVAVTGKAIRHYDLADGKPIRQFPLPKGTAEPLLLSPGARVLAVNNENGSVQLIDALKGKELHELKFEDREDQRIFAFSPDAKLFASVSQKAPAHVRFWSVETGKEKTALGEPDGTATSVALAFSADGRLLLTGHPREGLLRRWELATGRERLPFKVPVEVMHRDSNIDPKLLRQVLRMKAGEPKGEAEILSGVTLSPDGKLLTLVGNSTIYICSVASGRVLRRCVTGEELEPTLLTFSPDGKLLATIGIDNTISLWEVSTGTQKCTLRGHRGEIRQLAFTRNGRSLISASADGTALIWDVAEALELTSAEARARRAERKPDDLWSDLADDDAAQAETALRDLLAVPGEAVRLVRTHVKPVAPVEALKITRLIEELGSEHFETREEAARRLEELGEIAMSALHAAKDRPGSKERTRRIEQLLEKLDRPGLPGEEARRLRAVEILEQINTAEAREVLGNLAKGAADARLTRESKAALGRLGTP
jgi:WD40 repeat protein